MKKFLIIVSALVLSISLGAQSKDAVLKNLEKAVAATENPKKASNPSTWIKLAECYVNVYTYPQGGIGIGTPSMEARLFLKDQKVLSSEVKTYAGVEYTADTYEDKVVYYNPEGLVEIIQITQPLNDKDNLECAYNALMKAYEVDAKGSKKEDIAEQLLRTRDMCINEAMGAYTLGDVKTANKYFEQSLKFYDNPAVERIDSMITYYTAVTFNQLGQNEQAAKYFQKCIDINYHQNGDVYSSLAEIYKSQGDVEKAKATLNEGFTKYPTSQGILVSLINIYMESNDDPAKVLELIRTAQANEPTNASLHYAEGNVYKNLGDLENAIKCFYKSFEIDPNYVFGIYTVGSTYFDKAIEVQSAINELDPNDYKTYDILLADFEKYLLDAIEPFEKAFGATEDKEFRIAIADGLKQIYFRFRDRDPKYQEGFEKYSKYLEENDK